MVEYLRKFKDLYIAFIGYLIENVPVFKGFKNEFSLYYCWPKLPSPLYPKVPQDLSDKYKRFIEFGKLKRWLFSNWRQYVSRTIGEEKLDGKKSWIGESGKDKHLWNLANFEELKIKPSVCFCEKFIELLNEVKPGKVFEIGSGCGGWLSYFEEKYPFCEYHGYDISEEIVRYSSEYFVDRRNLFFHAGLFEQLLDEIAPDLAFFYGTAEFIPQAELEKMLKALKNYGNKYIVFYEPVTSPFDFNSEFKSRKRSRASDTFNHNYPFLLRALGYEVVFEKVIVPAKVEGANWGNVRDCLIIGKLNYKSKSVT